MRGEVIQYSDGGGLISGDDGQRYAFTAEHVGGGARLWPGAKVDFVPSGAAATEIYLLSSGVQPTRRTEDLGLWDYFKKCMRLYAHGDGRARRKEYWSFVLFSSLFFVALIMLFIVPAVATSGGGDPPDALFGVFALVFLAGIVGFAIPSVALLSRRLHDVGMSGWFALLSFVPYIGGLFAFVIALIPSQRGANQYGPSPFEADVVETFS